LEYFLDFCFKLKDEFELELMESKIYFKPFVGVYYDFGKCKFLNHSENLNISDLFLRSLKLKNRIFLWKISVSNFLEKNSISHIYDVLEFPKIFLVELKGSIDSIVENRFEINGCKFFCDKIISIDYFKNKNWNFQVYKKDQNEIFMDLESFEKFKFKDILKIRNEKGIQNNKKLLLYIRII